MSARIKIFLTSFLILFLELALIRFLPAQISYLGYYSNFILLASFIGIGTGILLAKKKINLIWFVPWTLLFLITFTSIFAISIYPDSNGEIHFHSTFNGIVIPEIAFIPLIFLLTALIFLLLSQQLGKLLDTLPSLKAYTWDILGSILGIIIFTLLSYLQTNPIVWFGIFGLIYLKLNWENTLRWKSTLFAFITILSVLFFTVQAYGWSPYQKITVLPFLNPRNNNEVLGYQLFANNISHQSAFKNTLHKEWNYRAPYEIFNKPESFKRVLIIGAGMGTDIELALKHASSIDAVEIDPVIYNAGKTLNPDKPYQDPKVHVYINDARSFLQNSKNHYNLIIFALPDSLMLASSHGNIRLESFLFTTEAFASAKEHLTPDGALVMYNYYREPWLIAKLAGMLKQVFQHEPYIISDRDNLAVLAAGGKLKELKSNVKPSIKFNVTPISATDDWPFLYLERPSLPIFYLILLASIFILTYFVLSRINGKQLLQTINFPYFFLGAGFLLLETKSIIQFSLLFGTTWITNAFVFLSILTAVLLAIRIASRFTAVTLKPLYITLAIALFIQYIFPLQSLLILHPVARYLIVSIVTFLPVFLANIIFSLHFKYSKKNSINFSSNLLGAAFGGILEYLALLIGYHQLILIIMACYFLAFIKTTPESIKT